MRPVRTGKQKGRRILLFFLLPEAFWPGRAAGPAPAVECRLSLTDRRRAQALPQAVKIEQRRNKQEISPSSLWLHPFTHHSHFLSEKRHRPLEKGARSPQGRVAAICGCRQSGIWGAGLSDASAWKATPVRSLPVGERDKNIAFQDRMSRAAGENGRGAAKRERIELCPCQTPEAP